MEPLNVWTWVQAHRTELLEAAGALWVLISLVVKLTPTEADDRALSRVRAALERVSFLQPRNSPGTISLPGARARRPLPSSPAEVVERPEPVNARD